MCYSAVLRLNNEMLRESIKAKTLNSESFLQNHLSRTARDLVQLVGEVETRVVFAESCTHGEVSVALGKHPGVSEFFCGSMTTYRDAEKAEWLGISEVGMRLWSSISAPVACQMARNVLCKTPEANHAASITGHLDLTLQWLLTEWFSSAWLGGRLVKSSCTALWRNI